MIGFFGGGLAMIWAGTQRTKKAKRFRKYLALIGRRESISITTLAQAMPVSVHKACDDLQDMLDSGILETGYLDMSTGRLILSDEGLQEEAPPAPEPDEPEPEEDVLDMNDDDAVLGEIRRLNDDIDDPVMSQKIDRIGEITGKIFAYQKQSPNRAGQLRSFLSYYLPTTLKILRAYARMEEQGVEGENIRSAKARIEGMMDKVVEGFEKQLDKLFQDDAMDIATDVQVLERMLEKDGLSGGGMTLSGGEPLMHADIALPLLREARHRRIKTAIETCGCIPWDTLKETAPYLNYVLFDVKQMDSEKHREGVGVGNELILSNLKKLLTEFPNLHVQVRTPIIPGFNDNDEFAYALGEFLKGYENVGYEALPYHRLGTQKYDFLSREYAMGDVSLPDGVAQRIQRIVDETRGAVTEEKK